MISHEELLKVIHYNEATGVLTYIKDIKRKKAGSIANTKHSSGYIQVGIYGEIYLAHRLIWFYITKDWPKEQIDHANHIRNDNRWCNLHEATNITNHMNRPMQKNNTSGFTGIWWHKQISKWVVDIKIKGKKIGLGCYSDKNEAIQTRKTANIKYGFHENHGSIM